MRCFFALAAVSFFGCAERYSTVDANAGEASAIAMVAGDEAVLKLRGSVLIDSTSVRRPLRMSVQGDHLIVADKDARAPVKFINRFTRRTDAVFGVAVPPDDGPLSPSAVAPTDADNCCEAWILDAPRQRLYLALGEPSRATVSTAESIALSFVGPALMFAPIDGKRFVVSGVFDTPSRFVITNEHGAPDRWFGELPSNVPEVPLYVQQHAYQSSMARRPGDQRLVVAARHASVLVMVDPNGSTVRELETPVAFFPSYGVRRPGATSIFAVNDSTRYGYVDIAASQDRIWGLFSGSQFGDDRSGAHFATELHVFGWNGMFLGRGVLDHAALTIASTASGDSVYITRRRASPAILLYTGDELATIVR